MKLGSGKWDGMKVTLSSRTGYKAKQSIQKLVYFFLLTKSCSNPSCFEQRIFSSFSVTLLNSILWPSMNDPCSYLYLLCGWLIHWQMAQHRQKDRHLLDLPTAVWPGHGNHAWAEVLLKYGQISKNTREIRKRCVSKTYTATFEYDSKLRSSCTVFRRSAVISESIKVYVAYVTQIFPATLICLVWFAKEFDRSWKTTSSV